MFDATEYDRRRNARLKAERHARGLLRTRGWTLAEKLAHFSMPEPNSGCLLWLARVDRKGYGRLYWNGRPSQAHRLAWESVNGPMPAGMCACHKCDNPSCVNPGHLFAASSTENNADRDAKGRGLKGSSGRYCGLAGKP